MEPLIMIRMGIGIGINHATSNIGVLKVASSGDISKVISYPGWLELDGRMEAISRPLKDLDYKAKAVIR
jgi:hypothetical protein